MREPQRDTHDKERSDFVYRWVAFRYVLWYGVSRLHVYDDIFDKEVCRGGDLVNTLCTDGVYMFPFTIETVKVKDAR